MARSTGLTASEWLVMECLWQEAPQTLMQLAARLKQEAGWAKSTTATMISRMEAKGLLSYGGSGRTRLYRPTVRREEVAVRETESLLARVYQGSVGMMMSTLAAHKPLSRQEIDELYAVLREAEREAEDD